MEAIVFGHFDPSPFSKVSRVQTRETCGDHTTVTDGTVTRNLRDILGNRIGYKSNAEAQHAPQSTSAHLATIAHRSGTCSRYLPSHSGDRNTGGRQGIGAGIAFAARQ